MGHAKAERHSAWISMQMISRDDWSCAIRRRCGPGTAERTGEILVYILGTHAGSRVAEPGQVHRPTRSVLLVSAEHRSVDGRTEQRAVRLCCLNLRHGRLRAGMA